ncbi:MAG TPA: cysteine desulfurase family protein [Planctomycetaceae bacterium]|jgi:cysteine desulfurase|nr:cysteine desulfurase family protein [Planctomycetaceae bacterium]
MSDPPRPIYLDHHATTPVDPRVFEAMRPFFLEKFGNAASVNHAFGWEAADAVEQAREEVARLLGTEPGSLIFTSGATEANNLALLGVARAAGAGRHIITTAAEHRSVLDPLRRLERTGTELTILPVDAHARVDPEQVAAAIKPNTLLVSVIFANNEVGSINRLHEIGAACRERRVLLHSDAVQAVGKIPLDLSESPIDLLSLSAHKLYGPKGVGALFVRRDRERIAIEPLVYGGGHERRLRSGTLPVPLIVGFGAACRIAGAQMIEESARLAQLRDRLLSGLRRELDGLHVNGPPTERLPGNLNLSFEAVDGEALMTGLSGLAVSSGSACTAADPEPSHVLRAMGVSDLLTRASLRFGLGRNTTPDEVDQAVQIVARAVRKLRQRVGVTPDASDRSV